MGLSLKAGDLVFLDTAPFIYFFEKHSTYFYYLEKFFNEVYALEIQIVTSIITLIEITTLPARKGNHNLVKKYRDFFTNAQNISLFPVDLIVAERTVELRAIHGLKTPDAIQLGTALTSGSDYIITNDKAWKRYTDQSVWMVDDI